MHPSVHSSTFYNSQNREATEVPINTRVDKEAVAYRSNGILRACGPPLWLIW